MVENWTTGMQTCTAANFKLATHLGSGIQKKVILRAGGEFEAIMLSALTYIIIDLNFNDSGPQAQMFLVI